MTFNNTLPYLGGQGTSVKSITTNNTNGTNWSIGGGGGGGISNSNITQSIVNITSDDITVKGVSLIKTLEKISERLLILEPNPELLEKHRALKEAYDQYKLLEALYQNENS